jgi:hypothetical protein
MFSIKKISKTSLSFKKRRERKNNSIDKAFSVDHNKNEKKTKMKGESV